MKNTLQTFPKFNMTLGQLPSSYLVSMSYEEQVLWLCNFLKTDILPKLEGLIEYNEHLEENLNIIANDILTEKIQNGELVVSLGINYNDEELTFSINSETSNELIESLSELTTPSNEVGE